MTQFCDRKAVGTLLLLLPLRVSTGSLPRIPPIFRRYKYTVRYHLDPRHSLPNLGHMCTCVRREGRRRRANRPKKMSGRKRERESESVCVCVCAWCECNTRYTSNSSSNPPSPFPSLIPTYLVSSLHQSSYFHHAYRNQSCIHTHNMFAPHLFSPLVFFKIVFDDDIYRWVYRSSRLSLLSLLSLLPLIPLFPLLSLFHRLPLYPLLSSPRKV